MTQKEKETLIVNDICARIPYGLKATTKSSCWTGVYDVEGYKNNRIYLDCPVYDEGDDEWLVESVVPYLRPMSSMTEEEKQKMSDGSALAIEPSLNNISGYCPETMAYNAFNIDFCLSRHLDYRGLIEKGLALEAPEGMYKIDG